MLRRFALWLLNIAEFIEFTHMEYEAIVIITSDGDRIIAPKGSAIKVVSPTGIGVDFHPRKDAVSHEE